MIKYNVGLKLNVEVCMLRNLKGVALSHSRIHGRVELKWHNIAEHDHRSILACLEWSIGRVTETPGNDVNVSNNAGEKRGPTKIPQYDDTPRWFPGVC